MRMRPGVLDAPIHEPLVDLGVGAAPRARHEQAAANVTHLPLDLPLLPASPGRARHGLHQMVRTHLLEAPVVVPLLAHEHRAHRRLHVVVDAPPADPAEEAEGALVRLEHHLLALAREDLDQLHPAVAEPACAPPSPWSWYPTEPRIRGSSRTGRPRPDRRSAAQRPATATTAGAGDARPWHSAEPRHSRPHSPETQGLHESAEETAGPCAPSSRWPPAGAQASSTHGPSFGIGWILRA